MLNNSKEYQLLETIFFNENRSLSDIADILYIGSATIYRMVNRINRILKEDYQFYIETNPCRIVGSEEQIRYFFYVYFFEKYPTFEWPFPDIDEGAVNKFLKYILEILNEPVDFAYFNVFKVIVMVNYVRYKNGHYVEVDLDHEVIEGLMPNRKEHHHLYSHLEHLLKMNINEEFFEQIFAQYLQPGLYLSYEDFQERVEKDADLADDVEYMRHILDELSLKNELPFPNKELVLYELYITSLLEYKEPQSGYILYDRNNFFAKDLANEFPYFYQQMYESMKKFRARIGKPLDDDGINFYIYSIFSRWENIVSALRRKLTKIKVIVVSDRHVSHAQMLKDFIKYEFNEQIVIDIFDGVELTPQIMSQLDYDLIVSAFPLKKMDDLRYVYISNVPKFKDYTNIQKHLSEIISERITK